MFVQCPFPWASCFFAPGSASTEGGCVGFISTCGWHVVVRYALMEPGNLFLSGKALAARAVKVLGEQMCPGEGILLKEIKLQKEPVMDFLLL